MARAHPHIKWLPCCAHVCDLLLEDIGKLPYFESTVLEGRGIVKFIRNHHKALGLYRKHAAAGGKKKELLKPGKSCQHAAWGAHAACGAQLCAQAAAALAAQIPHMPLRALFAVQLGPALAQL